jgi:hypothetical protein
MPAEGPETSLNYQTRCIKVVDTFRQAEDGREFEVPSHAVEGAISWTTSVILGLMHREWGRPSVAPSFRETPPGKRPSERMIIVILFWTLFEHLMDRFFDAATANLPQGVRRDLLRRHNNIGSRLDRLYKILFDTSFIEDLASLGHRDICDHISHVGERRNRFIHGDPEAIDDALVRDTVEKLQAVQIAWIELYNLRCTGRPGLPPVWDS